MKNYLKQARVKNNLTQSQLADLARVSRQTIHALEKSIYIPSTVLALKLAKVLSCKVEDLFELEESD